MLRLSLFSCEEFLLIILVRPQRSCEPPPKTQVITNAVHVELVLQAARLTFLTVSGLIKRLRLSFTQNEHKIHLLAVTH